MAVSVRFTCNGAGDGVPCESYVAVALDVSGGFADGLVFDAARRMFIVETEWHELPMGWRIEGDGTARCPEHAAVRS